MQCTPLCFCALLCVSVKTVSVHSFVFQFTFSWFTTLLRSSIQYNEFFFSFFQNWYILYRFPNISPMIIPQQKNNESNLKTSKKLSQFDSNFSISDEVNQTPGCTDTIPLLCSVTGNNSNDTVANTNTTVSGGMNGSTATLQSSNVCLSKQLSLEDIIYKTSISQWDASMENINLDCISTISNWMEMWWHQVQMIRNTSCNITNWISNTHRRLKIIKKTQKIVQMEIVMEHTYDIDRPVKIFRFWLVCSSFIHPHLWSRYFTRTHMQNKPHSNENLSFHFDSLGLPFRDHLQSILRISKWFFKLQKNTNTNENKILYTSC